MVLIKPVKSTKYLGFTLDSSLNWRAYIEDRCKSAAKLIHLLKRFLRLSWGSNTKNLKLLYKSVFLPTLLYGCSVWAGALRFKWCIKKLRSAQYKMIKRVARAFDNASALALLVITNFKPVEQSVLSIACKR